MSLVCHREPNESWKDCGIRYAAKYGLENDFLESFNKELAAGETESQACWNALLDWDLLDLED